MKRSLETLRFPACMHACTQIKNSVGMKLMLKTLQDALVTLVRADFRWSRGNPGLATYCALLLQVGLTGGVGRGKMGRAEAGWEEGEKEEGKGGRDVGGE